MRFPIDRILIDEDARDEPLTEEILGRLPHVPYGVGNQFSVLCRELALERDPLAGGKRILRLMRHKGAFLKPCPGTRNYVCCGLEILHIGQGCPMDCTYCALQVYLNRPVIEVFVNLDDLLRDLKESVAHSGRGFRRICTGEFTDSLALEPLTGLSARLVSFFSYLENASLELKTKTDFIESLLDVDPRGRTVLSFSVNSPAIAAREEFRAAALDRRIAAASRAQERGYRIGFHFDPIIPETDWSTGYFRTIDEIFRRVDGSGIAWISLGVLRFVPHLKDAVTSRFGPLPYFHDGFLSGLDGKSRLHSDRRIAIYRLMAERIRSRHKDCRIYLCMESPYVWEKSLGISMGSNDDLRTYLDDAVAA